MGKVLLLYASMTGNTEAMANIMKETVEKRGHSVVTKTFEMDPIDVEKLTSFDGILVGTYSWDDGTLPFEVEDFYEELDETDITGMPAGVFGSGESFYPTFGGAANLMGDRLEEKQANLVPERLIVELEPDNEDILRCQKFAEVFCKMIEAKSIK
ncbi:flavodoxin domain-containing protein [Lentibacillus amyloliquefaciens]|uniref:Flavodoxin n=1 Tax=Lentibacillus amyloliquefaciens TaxID=1472767 RepID=A0A0U4FX17_9BACI|nr:flavodoxin domain-containing protein [Lentibacillus amyloliquefaciens]ALX50309.1 flavodoxin [Lentibacillus amyloliquefaciens]